MIMDGKSCQNSPFSAIQERYEYWDRVPKRGLLVNGKPAITQIEPDKIGEYLIYVVRDPLAGDDRDPEKQAASVLRDSVLAGKSGLFTTYTGFFRSAKVSICSGGSGCSEVELAMNEFMEYTACDVFLRVGVSGGINNRLDIGDCVISPGIFREDGTSRAYIGDGFPACCHYEVIIAMVQAAEKMKYPYKLGITACMDSDYVGNGRPSVGGYLQPQNIEKLGYYNRAGVLNTDRESSIIVTMCNLFHRRGGAVFSVTDNIIAGKEFKAGAGADRALRLALEGLAELKNMDAVKNKDRKEHWYPSLGCELIQSPVKE
jgi:uridine phosphorylase